MPGGGAVSGRRAVFSTPLRRSNRAEKPRRSAKTVCASAKRRTMRCVSPHVSPQVVEKFCPLVWEMGKRTWACAGVACPALPLLSPAGAWRFWLPVDFAAVVPEGVVCLLCRLPTLPLACFPAPYPPSPLPQRGRGSPRLFHARGCAPCIPGVEPMVCRKTDRKRFPMSSAGSQGKGGRGRWNYPSHATAAFEMVLSPGAGRTNAARGAVPCPPSGGTGAGGVSRAGGEACPDVFLSMP